MVKLQIIFPSGTFDGKPLPSNLKDGKKEHHHQTHKKKNHLINLVTFSSGGGGRFKWVTSIEGIRGATPPVSA